MTDTDTDTATEETRTAGPAGTATATEYIRFESPVRHERGLHLGVFFLVNTLAREDRLTPEQRAFWRANNDWFDAAYTTPSAAYDREANPGAVAWFKSSATHLIERVPGYLDLLAAHGVPCRTVRSADPGRVVYEDDVQVVVVPYEAS